MIVDSVHNPTITVSTWNVLHRVHAENWGDNLDKYPSEQVRIAAITERIVGLLQQGNQAIALQEASGDLVLRLQETAPKDCGVYSFHYPRIPHLRKRERAPFVQLNDLSEHLVIVTAQNHARQVSADAFSNDPGKGWLAVELAPQLTIISTHVTFGEKRSSQLDRLANEANKFSGSVLILGDFNVDSATIAQSLGPRFTAATVGRAALATRPAADKSKSQNIDHIFVRNAEVTKANVFSANGASDHNIVTGVVTLAEQSIM